MPLTKSQQSALLTLAKEAVTRGLISGQPLLIDLNGYDPELTKPCATFVSLECHGQLRGSFGGLQATRPLVEDIAENAFAAAFCDRRFLPLAAEEITSLTIRINILSPLDEITFGSESDLITQLRPKIDGLFLVDGMHQANLLPSDWEILNDATRFLQELKLKAKLPATYWSDTLKVYRYTTEDIG